MTTLFKKHAPWLLPILAMAFLTPFTPALDLAISNYFYQDTHSFPQRPFYTFIFEYGSVPALVTATLALLCFLLANFFPSLQKWRPPTLVLVGTLAIGAGLITNIVLKDYWGRPRPRQVTEFGGTQPFHAFYQPNFFNQPEQSKSFPSGHASMGFYFFALALVGKRIGNRPVFWLGLILAFVLGGVLSWTRIAQGGHFFSDTMMSALVMWLTAYGCDKWIYSDRRNRDERANKTAK